MGRRDPAFARRPAQGIGARKNKGRSSFGQNRFDHIRLSPFVFDSPALRTASTSPLVESCCSASTTLSSCCGEKQRLIALHIDDDAGSRL